MFQCIIFCEQIFQHKLSNYINSNTKYLQIPEKQNIHIYIYYIIINISQILYNIIFLCGHVVYQNEGNNKGRTLQHT